ncbi:MAG TPA: isochorismatase family cysteine hydrolase [Woeseiaceae bacterium]|nr:isochorismatase family cysteine hydrolase [Woeseiaceae bacterium]
MRKIDDREFYDTLEEVVEPSHTAVLVIDQQNDFCHERGYYAQELGLDVTMTRALNEPINQLTAAARASGAMVIFTQYVIAKGFTSDSPMWLGIHVGAGLKSLDQENFYTIEGTWGAELYEHMDVQSTDHVIKKFRGSAFHNTTLDSLLKKNSIESLVIAGQVTEGCVESSIRAARDADYYTVLAKDAIGSVSRERHDRVMSGWLARTYCPDTVDIIDIWKRDTKA